MVNLKQFIHVSPGFFVSAALAVLILPLRLVMAWLIAMILHETFHLLAIKLTGGKVHKINVGIFGAQIQTTIPSNLKELVCILSGPAAGLMLLLIKRYVPVVAFCGCIHSVFNLLPLICLDGGSALLCVLRFFLPEDRSFKICQIVDRLVRVLLFAGVVFVSWKLSWGALLLLCAIFIFARRDPIKIPCKRGGLRVQ